MRRLPSNKTQAVAAALVVGAAVIATGFFTSRTAQASGVRKPYFAQTRIQHFDSKGALHRTTTLTDAVRADGSFSRMASLSDDRGGSTPRHEMMLAPEGIAMVIDADLKIKSTRSVTPDGLRVRTAVAVDCLTANPAPSNRLTSCVPTTGTLHGFRVHKLVRSNINADGVKQTIEARVAGDLDWKALEYNVYIDDVLRESRTVTYLIPGEPPASMFAVPKDYKEVSPADMYALSEESRGFKVSQSMLDGVRKRMPHGN